MRHLLEIDDLTKDELTEVLDRSAATDLEPNMTGQGVALVFEKPSARTRNSLEMAVYQLGANGVYIQGSEVGFDVRETTEDIAHTLAGYYDVVCARVFKHETLERMAATETVPIVNLLSDQAHPMQGLADILTLQQEFGTDISGKTIAYVGDPNNVWRSLSIAAGMLGANLRLAAPAGHLPSDADLAKITDAGGDPVISQSPAEAVDGADAVYTDVWVSMGEEGDADAKKADFSQFTVTNEVMEAAGPDAIFMHCLPAHRGEEVAAEVADGPKSRIWPQAENRMHTARGLLSWLSEQ
ncbi:MAG: ornithine carbamoyltransferase [Acidimicrobiia bacterium]|nr:ornithine carbamoyltransferase [Acidimicrobiia bacterium]MBT8193565.1 ornithine carbamoyltransferase [Acidimicrobiia bacterium]MBT8246279.1 ornithine carbamoyltransferase [Acidimicrobiia bacterium]NNF88708.1 ornithine carbamoyltransferase [Acidimicrobiia bacterium]NNJ47586.1 ornithine carbamoyltransferase [Acidimicrobiia bacterium]